MERLRAILKCCSPTRAVLFCLLPGLVLTTSLPAPASLCAAFGDTIIVTWDGQDPFQDDTELPDSETSFDDFWLPANARRRSSLPCAPDGFRASRFLWPLGVRDASRPCALWLTRFDPGYGHAGHFLADGRTLRLWFQSQTC
jgi:hypothetical protein